MKGLCNLTMVLALIIGLSAGLVLLPSVSSAKTDVVYASYKYVMGDNDTKNDAKRICFIEAKRRCLEKVGTYIESETEVKNYKLTKDEVRTYAAALTKVEVVNEKVKFEGESITIFMTVKAEVDTVDLKSKIDQIRADKSLQSKLNKQQRKIDSLEKKIIGLQSELGSTDYNDAVRIRRERKDAFDTLDDLSKIKYDIRKKTRLAVENVQLGMTPEEVIRVAGKPRSTKRCAGNTYYYNYGKVWVILEGGVVSCVIRSQAYSSCTSCSIYRSLDRIDEIIGRGRVVK